MEGRPVPSEPVSCERTVLKNPSEYQYLKIQLVFQREGVKLTAAQYKSLIVSAVKELHGEVGASCPLDLLKYDDKTLCAILRINSSGFVKQNQECSLRVLQVNLSDKLSLYRTITLGFFCRSEIRSSCQ
ncbi:unnamed protein product [Staurois parvus]|uniref:Ribonucleases P/MRP subunit Pop8-like domain-containing protein n=1 Tax=Staurois parvus TaxID=386267 RepID=A0ABN9B3D6_9NEOB|nr:unnamed protein product [Staurois parvus]